MVVIQATAARIMVLLQCLLLMLMTEVSEYYEGKEGEVLPEDARDGAEEGGAMLVREGEIAGKGEGVEGLCNSLQ